jgi:RNA polymerase sigma factor for flagellar operon FliA
LLNGGNTGRKTETPEQLFVQHLGAVERIIGLIVSRQHLTQADADEFASLVRLKLVDDDYAVLRKFQARSSLTTYLTVVVQRVFLDYRISQWGKWRPSAEARTEGPLAIRLEQMIVRDRLSFEEACSALEINHRVTVGRQALEALYHRLPSRRRRRLIGVDAAASVSSSEPNAESAALEAERRTAGPAVRAALSRALARLAPQDRLIVKLRYENSLSVAEISRSLRVDQKSLYRRLDQLLRGLRAQLEEDGVGAPEVLDLLGRAEIHVDGILRE